ELAKRHFSLPMQELPGLGRISEDAPRLQRADQRRVTDHTLLPILSHTPVGVLAQLSQRMELTCANHKLVRMIVLDYPPHRFDEVWCISPVPRHIEITERTLPAFYDRSPTFVPVR